MERVQPLEENSLQAIRRSGLSRADPLPSERKVLIKNHVYPYVDKAPFVSSGVSLFGALEFDADRKMVRCHECGAWLRYLNTFHLRTHTITTREYKLRHGINIGTPLAVPDYIAERKRTSRTNFKPQHAANLNKGTKTRPVTVPRHERDNLLGKCQAQCIFRVQTLSKQLGRTPTIAEVKGIGITWYLMEKHFGNWRNFMILSGLQARTPGLQVRRELVDFPSATRRLNMRGTWKKDTDEEIAWRRRA